MENNIKILETKNLCKWYPYHKYGILSAKADKWLKAVDGINLHVCRNEVHGIIGESGCGKSTMARMLTGLEAPTQGEIYYHGVSSVDLQKEDYRKFHRIVQTVFQNPFHTFIPNDTIGKILLRPLKLHNIGVNDVERQQLCIEALEKGGLKPAEDFLRRYPHELSGGQLQRISILRSLMLNPEFIVADEPISMLDVSVRAEILSMLLSLCKEKDAAMLFISHDISVILYVSDRVSVMYLGRIVESGETDEVIQNPKHPYTQALLSNCATIDPDNNLAVVRISGEPPSPINPGPGCYFSGRCPKVMKCCTSNYPTMTDFGAGHTASCFLYNEK